MCTHLSEKHMNSNLLETCFYHKKILSGRGAPWEKDVTMDTPLTGRGVSVVHRRHRRHVKPQSESLQILLTVFNTSPHSGSFGQHSDGQAHQSPRWPEVGWPASPHCWDSTYAWVSGVCAQMCDPGSGKSFGVDAGGPFRQCQNQLAIHYGDPARAG